jgi:hypothetical protein
MSIWPKSTVFSVIGKQTYKSGEYYESKSAGYSVNGFATQAIVPGTFYATPFFVDTLNTFDRIGVYRTAGAVDGNGRLGIYSDSGNRPGNLFLDAGEIVDFNNNQGYELNINQVMQPGKYWLVILVQQNRTVRAHGGVEGRSIGTTVLGDTDINLFVTGNQAYGALPAVAPATVLSLLNPPRIFLRSV